MSQSGWLYRTEQNQLTGSDQNIERMGVCVLDGWNLQGFRIAEALGFDWYFCLLDAIAFYTTGLKISGWYCSSRVVKNLREPNRRSYIVVTRMSMSMK